MSENGFNDLSKQLNKMAKNAKNLEKKKQISFYELFTEKFMTKNTSFKSVDEFADASNFDWSTDISFEAIPENEMDKFVVSNSKFSSGAAEKFRLPEQSLGTTPKSLPF